MALRELMGGLFLYPATSMSKRPLLMCCRDREVRMFVNRASPGSPFGIDKEALALQICLHPEFSMEQNHYLPTQCHQTPERLTLTFYRSRTREYEMCAISFVAATRHPCGLPDWLLSYPG